MDNYIKKELDESHEFMKNDVNKKLGDIYDDVGEQCKNIAETYIDIFDTFAGDINNALDETSAHKDAIERDIIVLKDIKNKVSPFFKLWDEILNGKAGE